MSIVYVLLVAHFVGDWLLQSDWMAIHKSKRWDALALHVAVYGAVLYAGVVVLVLAFDLRPPVWNGGLDWLAVNVAAHFVQDAITSRINAQLWFFAEGPKLSAGQRSYLLAGGSRHWFFVAIGADQLLHYLTLFVTAGWWLQ